MKKIVALPIIAALALGVAACHKSDDLDNAASTDSNVANTTNAM